jgi:PHD/YefM family antitoxin component YafN of YafNO toxin-antitoxin module
MDPDEPMTQTLNTADIKQQWSTLLDKIATREARVIVEEGGVPVAAIISLGDLKRLQRLEAEQQADLATLRASQKGFKDVPPEELERELAKALAEVRADRGSSSDASARAS